MALQVSEKAPHAIAPVFAPKQSYPLSYDKLAWLMREERERETERERERERERKREREEKREDLEGLENLFFPQWEEKNEFLFRLH